MIRKSNVIITIIIFVSGVLFITLLNNQAQFLTWTSTNWGGYLPASTGEF